MKIPGSVTGSGSQEYWSYLSKGGIRHGALPMMNLTTTLCKFQNNKITKYREWITINLMMDLIHTCTNLMIKQTF